MKRNDDADSPTMPSPKGSWLDPVFLFVLGLAAALPYLADLGFYADDWWQIARAETADDRSVGGLFGRIYVERPRPVFYGALALAMRYVGTTPLALHALNTAVLAGVAAVLCVVLRRLSLPRPLTLAIPAVYLLLPQYSATRFWLVASALNLSFLLALIGLFGGLRAVAAAGYRRLAWTGLWLAGTGLSLLTYGTVLPLLLTAPVLFLVAERRRARADARPSGSALRALVGHYMLLVGVVVPVLVWKAWGTDRLREVSRADRIEWFTGFIGEHAYNNWVGFGVRLPAATWHAAARLEPFVLAFVLLIGVVFTLHLVNTARAAEGGGVSGRGALAAVGIGVGVWVGSLAPFFLTHGPNAAAAGIGNRVVNVASVGSAIIVVGIAGVLACAFRTPRARHLAWSVLVGLHVSASLVVINGLATYWTQAADEQEDILAEVRGGFPDTLPAGVLVVDGVCPYVGPGIVFESSWDLRAALAAEFGEWPAGANVIRPSTSVGRAGLVTSLYDGFLRTTYPYGDLHVYDVRTGALERLVDRTTALAYFARRSPPSCPRGHAGRGVRVPEAGG